MEYDKWLRTAYSYLYIREFDKAMEAFRRAIHDNPENPVYFFHASITALRNGQLDDALALAQTAVRLETENPLYQQHLGVVLARGLVADGVEAAQQGCVDRARELFEEALVFDPLNTDAAEYVIRGDMH